MRFANNTPIAEIKVKGPLGEKMIEATIDTGAFKSLIPLEICHDLGLHLKEEREVRGVCEKPVKVKIKMINCSSVHFNREVFLIIS